MLVSLAGLRAAAQPKFKWAKGFQGYHTPWFAQNQGYKVFKDAGDNVFVFGQMNRCVDFDPGATVDSLCSATNPMHNYVARFSAQEQYRWSRKVPILAGVPLYVSDSPYLYVAGAFSGTIDVDPGPAVSNLTASTSTGQDLALAKYDTAFNLIWAKSVANVSGNALHIKKLIFDRTGNLVLVGQFNGTADFNLTSTSTTDGSVRVGALTDGYAVKYNRSGDFLWSRFAHCPNGDNIYGVAFDKANNMIVAGTSGGLSVTATTFTNGSGAPVAVPIKASTYDGFLAKYSASGALQWAKTFGGEGHDELLAVATDTANNIIVAGTLSGTDTLDPAQPASSAYSAGGVYTRGYLLKLSPAGAHVWHKMHTGVLRYVFNLAVDDSSNIYTAGMFDTSLTLMNGSATFASYGAVGWRDLYLAKLRPNGNYVWSVAMGSDGYDEPGELMLDRNASIYLTGFVTRTTDFAPADTGGLVNYAVPPTATFLQNTFIAKWTQPAADTGSGTAVEEASITPSLHVYPNPASSELRVEGAAEGAAYRVLSLTGVEVRTGVFSGGSLISLEKILPGVYILQLTQPDGRRAVVRIAKQ